MTRDHYLTWPGQGAVFNIGDLSVSCSPELRNQGLYDFGSCPPGTNLVSHGLIHQGLTPFPQPGSHLAHARVGGARD